MVRREVHPNWNRLMEFCERACHGEMMLTFSDGVPVFAKTVQLQMRFGPVHDCPRRETVDSRSLDAHDTGK